MKQTKRVIILSDVKSPVISQAIFILRDGEYEDFSALSEAERIVSEYMEKKEKQEKNRTFLYLTAFIFSVIVVFMCIYFKF